MEPEVELLFLRAMRPRLQGIVMEVGIGGAVGGWLLVTFVVLSSFPMKGLPEAKLEGTAMKVGIGGAVGEWVLIACVVLSSFPIKRSPEAKLVMVN